MIDPTERTIDESNAIRLRRRRSFDVHVHLQERYFRSIFSVLMIAAYLPIGAVCPSHSEEGAARVGWHACVARAAVCARTDCRDDRKNRSVLVLMADWASICGAHNRPFRRMVWLPLLILARP